MRISVLGCGYLGATHAAAMASLGHEVIGVDVRPEQVNALNTGVPPFHEPGLAELLAVALEGGRLRFTEDLGDVADWAEVHFLCTGTPQRAGELGADLSQVTTVVETLAPLLTRPTTILGKSTVPVGTAKKLTEVLRRLAPAGQDIELCWNPEFLREGHAVQDTLHPDRLVLGTSDGGTGGEAVLREIYREEIESGTPLIVTDLATAELVKSASNGFLATKISYINAMSELCDAAGADVRVLARAMGLDPRIGDRFLGAGLGFGGGCLPKDIRAFMARAGELGIPESLAILREVDTINQRQRSRAVELASEMLDHDLTGSRVAVLGVAFKPDSDDVRDSPALNVAGRLHLLGAHVTVYDPAALENARALFPTLAYARSMDEAAHDADLVLVLTEWPEFRQADPELLGKVVRHRRILDARNCLDDRWARAGWEIRRWGAPNK